VFARKNYFLSGLAEGLTRFRCTNCRWRTEGSLEVEVEGRDKRIGITRLHMEEDAAKNLHEGFSDSDRWSYIDYNRCGVAAGGNCFGSLIFAPGRKRYSYLTTLKQVLSTRT